jgi:hypothetical protein
MRLKGVKRSTCLLDIFRACRLILIRSIPPATIGRWPNWALLELKYVSDLLAIQWKQVNLVKMPEDKHKLALEKLKEVLGV